MSDVQMNKIQNHVELLMILDKLMLVKSFYIHEYAKKIDF
jgi:hypothetical protein